MASNVSATDEALQNLQRAVHHLHDEVQNCASRGLAGAQRVVEHCRSVRRERQAVLDAAERALASASPDDDVASLRAAVDRARIELDRASRAVQRATGALETLSGAQRRVVQQFAQLVPSASAELTRMLNRLDAYRAPQFNGSAVGLGSSSVLGQSAASGAAPSPRGGSSAPPRFASTELHDVPVDSLDFSDNPFGADDLFVTGSRHGMSLRDYEWAAETWETVVRPGVERGMTHDDFAARDRDRSADPSRRYAGVYDMYLGSDPIRVSRRSDGSYSVDGGRHRVELARRLGIRSLPVRITG